MPEALTISRSAPEGNAFNILGQVRKILIEADMVEEAEEYFFKATATDYENLIEVSQEYAAMAGCELQILP